MISLIRHIEYLMTCHDCVVIPGLGAVLGIHTPAVYDEDGERMFPPRRRYAFNAELVDSDGLIANSIARAECVDYRTAADIVAREVEEMKRSLRESGEVTLGRIGRIEMTANRIVTFVPFERDLLTPLVDWLPTFAVSQAGTLRYHRPAGVDDSRSQRSSRRRIKVARFVRNTIGAAAAILIGIAVSTPVSVERTHEASLSIPPIKKVATIVPTTDTLPVADVTHVVQADTMKAAEQVVVAEVKAEQPKPAEPVVAKPVKKPATKEARFNDNDEFIVVVGSLNTMAEAEKYIARQKKANAALKFGIACQGSRIRVYAATGKTSDEARRMAKTPAIARQFKGAWVTTRN